MCTLCPSGSLSWAVPELAEEPHPQTPYRLGEQAWAASSPDLWLCVPCPSSGENRTTMHKCYTFLIFMVLLLPSLGLSRWVSEGGMGAGGWGGREMGSNSGSLLPCRGRGPMPGGHIPRARGWSSPSPGILGHSSPPHLPSPLLSSLDLFFRWLFDKKFLAEAAIRFE